MRPDAIGSSLGYSSVYHIAKLLEVRYCNRYSSMLAMEATSDGDEIAAGGYTGLKLA